MKIVVPQDTLNVHGDALRKIGYYDNFALLFRHYVPWRKDDYKFDDQKWQEFEKFNYNGDMLHQLQSRGTVLIRSFKKLGLPTVEFSMHTTWRLITGIGASSSLEVGMILHHVYGIPYIPASSIKGLLRYYLKKVEDVTEDELNKLFGYSEGENAAKGAIVFLDAFPLPGFGISVDIMNNHYHDYYMNDKPPADWMDPKLIKFLSIKNATFVFRLFANSKDVELEKLENIAHRLSLALIDLGIGAKTAVGYGRMEGFQPIMSNDSEVEVGNNEESPIDNEFYFYDEPDGTREYYLTRLAMIEAYSDNVQWLFQKWERDEQWKNDPEIARAFLPKIKKTKKNGK